MTTPNQIGRARLLADEIAKLPRVRKAVVDDWGDSGSFNLFVTSDLAYDPSPLRGVLQRIKTVISKYGEFEWAEAPRMTYQIIGGRKYPNRYDRHDYKISVYIYDHV